MEFDLDQQFDHGELLLSERRCRVCGSIKNLIEGFYITHKNSTHLPSSYSYECKECTVKRVIASRKRKKYEDGIKDGDFYEEPVGHDYIYPDW
tara:strand:+ start:204 stop:482 length:279 start_codon:yes stop_codon:yes gene_type:complete